MAIYGYITFSSSYGMEFALRICFSIFSPLFLVLSIFLHELCHAWAYIKIYKVWVQAIYLYAMGGLTTATVDPNASRKSMAIVVSIAGPAANFVLGGLFLGAHYIYKAAASSPNGTVLFMLFFLGITQMALGIYNMIPGVPLDGSNALVGAFRCCMTDSMAKKVAYSIGIVVIIAVIVVVIIFLSLYAGIFLVMALFMTCWALYEVIQSTPKSQTNPTY